MEDILILLGKDVYCWKKYAILLEDSATKFFLIGYIGSSAAYLYNTDQWSGKSKILLKYRLDMKVWFIDLISNDCFPLKTF